MAQLNVPPTLKMHRSFSSYRHIVHGASTQSFSRKAQWFFSAIYMPAVAVLYIRLMIYAMNDDTARENSLIRHCAWANWPRNFRTKHSIAFRNLLKQILGGNHVADGWQTIMDTEPEESRPHTIHSIWLAHTLRWHRSDITSIDGTITDVIVYRVHSEVLTGINRGGIAQYGVIYQLAEISMPLDRIGACWFRFCYSCITL